MQGTKVQEMLSVTDVFRDVMEDKVDWAVADSGTGSRGGENR